MSNVWYLLRRELGVYLRSPVGYIMIAVALGLEGLAFNAFALIGQHKSSEVLETFFFWSGGITAAVSIFVAMRLIAEERQSGTLALLATSPLRDWQIVLGKFLGGVIFLVVLNALSIYMPLLILVHGKISLGHLFAGYLGVILFASSTLALGLLCSAVSPNQLVAVILGSGVVLIFILLWALSKIADPPLEDILAYLSLHNKHFRPFMRGLISVQDLVFYLSLIYVSLTMTTRVLETRRWR
ncbi:MAG: ABC transporter permease subunit [Deltaproteobacteria bacterium]|nr:ABC transporter permease subunit [Deltaproteobacteria bacterium]